MDTVQEKIDLRDAIMAQMRAEGRTMTWLVRTTELPYTTLYPILVQKTVSLTQDKLDKINAALKSAYTLEVKIDAV